MNAAQGASVADLIIRPAAHQIALEVAAEWINRPWVYEITPPDVAVPPVRGILGPERSRANLPSSQPPARPTPPPQVSSSPKSSAPTPNSSSPMPRPKCSIGTNSTPMTGPSPYDQPIEVPEIVYRRGFTDYTAYVGAARRGLGAWASVAGRNWLCPPFLLRLLYQQLQLNPELSKYFDDAGIISPHGAPRCS